MNKVIKLKHILHIIAFAGFILLMGCAKQGSPTGGPKDEDPPKVVLCSPPNYSTQFNETQIQIEFDEYIDLKDINSQLLVSPPFKEQPIVKPKGKYFEIEFEDTLKENATYTFNFGNAIVDNHEGNALSDYEYVFSTGDYIDSLSLQGKMVDAFTLKPSKEPFFVMLYENLSDSAPLLEIPSYINRSNAEGFYSINNVKNDTFRVFALKDANNNLIFDLPNEIIAFYDTTMLMSGLIYNELNPSFDSLMIIIDTVATLDSIIVQYRADTSHYDTIPIEIHKNYAFHLNLFSFEQEIKSQYLTSTIRPKKNKLLFNFNIPLNEPLDIKLINDSIQVTNWYVLEDIFAYDTLKLWILDTTIANLENITTSLSYYTYDSLEQLELTTDTIDFRYIAQPVKSKKTKDEDLVPKPTRIKIVSVPKNNGSLDLNQELTLTTSVPIDSIDLSKLDFFKYIDTIEVPQPYTIQKDSILGFTKFLLSTKWEESTTYKLIAYPGAFHDMYDYGNDTTTIVFVSRPLDYYGRILLTITDVGSTVIAQLIDKSENVLDEEILTNDGLVTFDYLPPKEYKFKFIIDKNGNGKWDTGNYLKNIQPERVGYYPEAINVRSNWDVEVEWSVNKIE
ncbi:MAG: Ig-like domain-containing protein [Bacteroidales bacterium]|nr:Ig-like domain-containing protein [Bacteroidales bacterium]